MFLLPHLEATIVSYDCQLHEWDLLTKIVERFACNINKQFISQSAHICNQIHVQK